MTGFLSPKRRCFGLAVPPVRRIDRLEMGRNAYQHRDTIGRLLRTSADAAALFAPGFSKLAHEELRVAHLDAEGRILGVSAGADGHAVSIGLPLREIVRDAIILRARALVLAHNHP